MALESVDCADRAGRVRDLRHGGTAERLHNDVDLVGHSSQTISVMEIALAVAVLALIATAVWAHWRLCNSKEDKPLPANSTRGDPQSTSPTVAPGANTDNATASARSPALAVTPELHFGAIIHDIRVPLTAIVGFAEHLLDERTSDQEIRDGIHTIRSNGEYMLRLLDDVLELGKLRAGHAAIEPRSVDFRAFLGDIVRPWTVTACRKQITIETQVSDDVPPYMLVDPSRLRRVVENLLANAIKFTDSGGVYLRVALEPTAPPFNNQLNISVIDSGPGIATEHQARILEPYAQVDATIERTRGGTGLGLYISKAICEAMGGCLRLTSVLGQGSCFSAVIPFSGASAAPVPESRSVERRVSRDLCGFRILLVEDGADNQRLIRAVLSRAGARVETANDGVEGTEVALNALRQNKPFDVVLMDLDMPRMNGIDATIGLRRESYVGPIVGLTAAESPDDRRRCVEAGFTTVALKPIRAHELVNLVASFVAHQKFDDFIDDSRRGRVVGSTTS